MTQVKQATIICAALIAFCFTLSVINMAFAVDNRHLERQISKASEDKANLRADFLTMTSLNTLTSSAERFKMKQVSNKDVFKVKSAAAKVSWLESLDDSITKLQSKLHASRTIVSGY